MAILITDSTRVIVQGMSGRIGSFHSADMIRYGTNVVGGVVPGMASSCAAAIAGARASTEAAPSSPLKQLIWRPL